MTDTGEIPGLKRRFSLYFGALFFAVGIQMPFFPLFLSGRGLEAAEIGLVLAIGQWIRVGANPIIAQIADRRGDRRRPLNLLIVGATLAFALYGWSHSFAAIIAVAMLFSLFMAPVMPLGDNLAMLAAGRSGMDYGRVRLWGSVTFIFGSMGAGWVLDGRSSELVWVMVLAAFAVAAAVSFLLPDIRAPKAKGSVFGPFRLLRHPLFVLFLVASAANMASHAVLFAFGTLHWRSLGHSDFQIGILWALATVAEIVFFVLSRRLVARFTAPTLLAMALAAGALRWLMTAWVTHVVGLMAVQALHAFTFAAAHLGAMHFLTRSAPPEYSASAQSLNAAIGGGAAMGIGLMASGVLYGNLGGDAFLVMAAISAVGFVAALWLGRHWDGGPLAIG